MYNIHVITMSTRTLDGTYSTFLSNVRTNANARFGAIGVVGHMVSGVKTDADGNTTAVSGVSNRSPGANQYSTFGTGRVGIVYEFNNFGQAVAKLGNVPANTWVAGTYSNDGADTSPYDTEHNLIRQLELIYLANPTAKTYVAVLEGTGTSAAAANTDAGVSDALTELIKYDDISFIVGAGMDFNTTLASHANTASSITNKAERIYVGGSSINRCLASGSLSPDISDFSALQQSTGRAILSVTNVKYRFQSGLVTESAAGQEIGGNFYAGYVAGFLSRLPEQVSMLRQSPGFLQVYNGNEFRWSRANQESLVGSGVLTVRSVGGAVRFGRALTYSDQAASEYTKITKRRIVDRVSKELRATADTFIGKVNTASSRLGMEASIKSKLSTLSSLGLIDSAALQTRVWVEGTDVADGRVRVSVIFRPITEIEFVEIQQTVEL